MYLSGNILSVDKQRAVFLSSDLCRFRGVHWLLFHLELISIAFVIILNGLSKEEISQHSLQPFHITDSTASG